MALSAYTAIPASDERHLQSGPASRVVGEMRLRLADDACIGASVDANPFLHVKRVLFELQRQR
jgi:hypothetical protein